MLICGQELLLHWDRDCINISVFNRPNTPVPPAPQAEAVTSNTATAEDFITQVELAAVAAGDYDEANRLKACMATLRVGAR